MIIKKQYHALFNIDQHNLYLYLLALCIMSCLGQEYKALRHKNKEGLKQLLKPVIHMATAAPITQETKIKSEPNARPASKSVTKSTPNLNTNASPNPNTNLNPNPNLKTDFTSWINATKDNNIEALKNLLRKNTDLHAENQAGYTRLMIAAEQGNKEAIACFQDYKDKLDSKNIAKALKVTKTDEIREMLTQIFYNNEVPSIIPDPTTIGFTQDEHTSNTLEHNAHMPPVHINSTTAAQDGDMENIDNEKRMNDACIADTQNDDMTPVNNTLDNIDKVNRINDACITAAQDGDMENLKKRLKEGADVNAIDPYSFTALMRATKQGHIKIVEKLLKKGASVDNVNNYGQTALIVAASHDQIEIVEKLLEKNADVNIADKEGRTALMFAAEKGSLEIVKKLLENEADVHTQNKINRTALMYAAWKGHTKIVNELLEKNSDVNIADKEGKTALMFATEGNYKKIVQCLLKHNQKPSQDEIKKALQCAKNKGNPKMIKILKEAIH